MLSVLILLHCGWFLELLITQTLLLWLHIHNIYKILTLLAGLPAWHVTISGYIIKLEKPI